MKILANNQEYTFVRCLSGKDGTERSHIWKTFIQLEDERVELEVENECQECNIQRHPEVNWGGVRLFIEMLKKEIENFKKQSFQQLLFLAKSMGFLEKEYAQNPTFTLDFINYLHSNHQHSQIKYINQTGYHRFELYFILESNDNIDHYAQWVTYTIYNSK